MWMIFCHSGVSSFVVHLFKTMTATSSDWIIQWSNSLVSLWSSHFLVASAPLQNWAGSDVNLSRLHLNSVTVMQSLVLQAEQSFRYRGAVREVWRWKVSFQDWVNIRTERLGRIQEFCALIVDSRHIILFLDVFSLRQRVGQLQLDLVWVKQPFRDSRRREGGAEEGARSAPRLQVFWHCSLSGARKPVATSVLCCWDCVSGFWMTIRHHESFQIWPIKKRRADAVRCDYPL